MMMKLNNFWVLVLMVGMVVSCKPDPEPEPPAANTTGTLKVNFNLNWNGQSFTFNTPYYDQIFNYRIQIELVKFLMYNFTVKNNAGVESIVKDAELLNFTSNQFSLNYTLEQGNYDGLKFGIGVGDSAINHGDPAVFAPTHALSYNVAADMHWTWNTGYIFLKFEGRADTTTNGTGALDRTFSYHTGDNSLYGEINFYSNPFSISANSTTDFNISVDLSRFFFDSNDTINVKSEFAAHSLTPLNQKFARIYLNAFSAQ